MRPKKVIELNEDNMEKPIEAVENSCGCCALVNIARNIRKLVETENIITSKPCNSSCMTINDSMLLFVTKFINLAADLRKSNVRTLSTFKKNFQLVKQFVLIKVG